MLRSSFLTEPSFLLLNFYEPIFFMGPKPNNFFAQ